VTTGADRRSVLTGLGALGLMGCDQAQQREPVMIVPRVRLDLSALEGRHGGRLGVSAWSATRVAGWRDEERFVYCSTFKAYLAAATLLRVQAGEERLDRLIPVTAADMINHAPVTEAAVGGTLTVEQLMEATVGLSDNPAANILIRELGGLEAMRGFYRGIGDQSTRVDRLEPEMNRLDGDKDTITPARSAVNLRRLFVSRDTPLSTGSKERLLRWMFETPTGPGRIKAGVPVGWRVAHKTGTGGYGPTNDIGLLYPPAGAPITLAIYYHGVRASSDTENEAVIADATRITLAALDEDVPA
jgi:beta-lactamase class A